MFALRADSNHLNAASVIDAGMTDVPSAKPCHGVRYRHGIQSQSIIGAERFRHAP